MVNLSMQLDIWGKKFLADYQSFKIKCIDDWPKEHLYTLPDLHSTIIIVARHEYNNNNKAGGGMKVYIPHHEKWMITTLAKT